MKKQFFKILLGLSLLYNFSANIKAQNIDNRNNGISININPLMKGRAMEGEGCGGSGNNCMESIEVLTDSNAEMKGITTFKLYKTASNKLNLIMPKAMMNSEQQADFFNRDAYFLEKDLKLKPSVWAALHESEIIVLQYGWHPLIELEDCFIISFTLKK